MKLEPSQVKLLRFVLRKRPRRELKACFALIRSHDDRALLAALAPVKKRKAAKRVDPLARDLEKALRPVLGPASEKAELLVEYMAKKHRRKLDLAPKGLADAARQLRATFTDEQIRGGARTLVAQLNKLYGQRETVV